MAKACCDENRLNGESLFATKVDFICLIMAIA
jgi:hypothetical protein